jgi:hypothetical protein
MRLSSCKDWIRVSIEKDYFVVQRGRKEEQGTRIYRFWFFPTLNDMLTRSCRLFNSVFHEQNCRNNCLPKKKKKPAN